MLQAAIQSEGDRMEKLLAGAAGVGGEDDKDVGGG